MIRRFLLYVMFAGSLSWGTISSSTQGSVSFSMDDFQGNVTLRRVIDEAEKTFFHATGYTPGDAPPILFFIRQKGTPASLRINAMEGGGPEIRLILPKGSSDALVSQFVTTALLLRQFYGKSAPVPGSEVPQYPTWMTRGLGALIFSRHKIMTTCSFTPELEAFLSERVPDPENEALLDRYDAIAAVLVRSGLSDDPGKKAFRDWIGSYDPAVPMKRLPPWVEGWDMHTIERRWNLALQVSEHDHQLPSMIQDAASTLRAFRAIMIDGYHGKESLAEVAKEKGGEYYLQSLSERLAALRLQANPLAVSLVERSMKLVANAKRLPSKKVRKEEEQLHEEESAIGKQACSIEDYLDWVEATKVMTRSGLFDAYLSSPPYPPMKGPIGRQIDAVEGRGW